MSLPIEKSLMLVQPVVEEHLKLLSMSADLPSNEEDRLEALHSYGLIDAFPEKEYDDFSFLASMVSGASMASISLVDRDHQLFKSRLNLSTTHVPREISFCAYAILEPNEIFEVQDTALDNRFSKQPRFFNGKQVRFYAGWPLLDVRGYAVGALCVMDHQPKILSSEQRAGLQALGRRAATQLQLSLQLNLTSRQNVTDALTGVSNRRAFNAKITSEWNRHVMVKKKMALIVFDVDNFKTFNDKFGHDIGDTILMQVAASVTSVLRRKDFFARYGGEEFALVLEESTEENALTVAEKIRKTIEFFPWSYRPITISSGICVMQPEDGVTLNRMISRADMAMYQAKKSGRNCVRLWRESDGDA